jgi:multidrug efflux pump subunit AcrA (membrane-fusion protein)
MQKKYIFIPIGILLAGFIVMQLLMSSRVEPERSAPRAKVKMVNTEIINLKDVSLNVVAYGRLSTAQPITIFSEVNGILRSGDVIFQPAQNFKKGNLLAAIDDRQIQLDINSAKSDFLTALATVLPEIKVDFPDEYQVWQTYFDGCRFDTRLSPLPQTDNQKIKLYLSRFNIYKLYFQTRNLEIQSEKHYFYAPFNGSIISADLRPGSTARVGSQIGKIINLDDMEVEAPVPARDLNWIERNKDVVFTSSELNGTWTGRIKRIGKQIDDKTQTIPLFITIKNSHKQELFDGIFLKAEIPGRTIEHAVNLPRNTIYDERYVYLIKDGRLKKQEISIARTGLEEVIVNEGLSNGDTLVTGTMQGVADGMLARPIMSGNDQ